MMMIRTGPIRTGVMMVMMIMRIGVMSDDGYEDMTNE